jgi:uncharacterized protein YdeI (YjbR/CyaY-like superfamily)
MKPRRKQASKSFKATLELFTSTYTLVLVRIPFNVSKVWGTRGRVRVKGEINGFAFRSAVFPTREGFHCLSVNKRLRTGACATVGDTVHFRLEPDTAKRVTTVPIELQRLLNEDRSFRRWFDHLPFSMRMWISHEIAMVKNPASRLRRAERIAELLLSTMEAELDLPPILKRAFAAEPRAYQGWQSMTPIQRRNWLLSILNCRTPESRDRRISRMFEDALARAEGKRKTKSPPDEPAHEELW